MSYRTNVNDTQIFGNNEWYQEWIDFLKSEGIKVDREGLYDGYIVDLKGMFDTIDVITKRLIAERHKKVVAGEEDWEGKPLKELTDLSGSMWLDGETSILMFNVQMKMPIAFYHINFSKRLKIKLRGVSIMILDR